MIEIHKHNTYLVMTGDRSDFIKLEKHFNRIPTYQMLPSYQGIKRPEVFLHRDNYNGMDVYWMSKGLSKELFDRCRVLNIRIEGLESTYKELISFDEFSVMCKEWTSLEPRPYQIEAAWNIVNRTWSTSELATRAGKTLICSLVLRYMMQYQGIKKVLFIVPSIHLVKQGIKDLKEYMNFFSLGEVWAGGDIVGDENCIIGTFQSIVLRLDPKSKHHDPKFFDGIDLVLVDEAHKASCKSIDTIIRGLKDVKMRFGVTGTIPKDIIDRFKVWAMLGPTIQHIQANELIESGYLAEAHIEQVFVDHKYDDDTYIEVAEKVLYKGEIPKAMLSIKESNKSKYVDILKLSIKESSKALMMENMLMQHNMERMDKILSLCDSDKNTIVFIHNVDYGKRLKEYFESKGRITHLINGSIGIKKRQKILDILESSNGNILVGSFGSVGTGLTFNNIHTGIFAQSFKSDIITKQSLGRLMLKNESKDKFYLYDFVDTYETGKLIQHSKERMKIYKNEKLIN